VAALVVSGSCALLEVEQGGVNLISLDEEWAMRDDLMRQVEQQYPLVRDRAALDYLDRIGRSIVAETDLADREWDFGIVDSPDVNAFNLPGGLVYVNRGLVEQASSLDQLTAVLGHEIAHGVARHGTQLMTRAVGLDVLLGVVLGDDPSQVEQVLGGVVGSGALSRYGRGAEREADHLGIGYAHAAGYDPRGAAEMFRKLLALRQREPSAVDRFFSSHPLTEERIEAAEARAAELPRGRALVDDTPEYQSFRDRAGT